MTRMRPSTPARLRRAPVAAGLALLAGALAAQHAAAATAPSTLVVTNARDFPLLSPGGTLRDAILRSNALPGRQTITFAIPGSGVHRIQPGAPLPQITDPVTIDGYTQTGAREATASRPARLKIVLDGSRAGAGLDIGADDTVVRGLSIQDVGTVYDTVPGIQIGNGSGTVIAGNHIGTTVAGDAPAPNAVGVAVLGEATGTVIGGPDPADRNVISGNLHYDVWLDSGPYNVVQGNRIGTTADGEQPIFPYIKDYRGVRLTASDDTVRDNLIGNSVVGVALEEGANVVRGNWIGLDAAGASAIPNDVGVKVDSNGNRIGGHQAGHGNVLSGNAGEGVEIEFGTGNRVEGNLIGTDPTGTSAIPNDSLSVGAAGGVSVFGSGNTIGGSAPGAGNVISGNAGDGVGVLSGADRTNVLGNLIGTDASGAVALPNTGSGVRVEHSGMSAIGGTAAGEPNTIAFNDGDGVTVASGTVAILENAIHQNDGLGIDLGPDGITENDYGTAFDSDAGANGLQNFPVIGSAFTSGGRTTISWRLDSTPRRTFRVEFFAVTCDPGSYGEGDRFLGSVDVRTDASGTYEGNLVTGALNGAPGVTATASAKLQLPKLPGQPATTQYLTSELSACVAVG